MRLTKRKRRRMRGSSCCGVGLLEVMSVLEFNSLDSH
jgi:hypothetical protein